MFGIEYKIIKEQFTEIDRISDEEIRYSFLLGNLILLSSDIVIKMEWKWIPLLDFAYCLKKIIYNLKIKDSCKECFDFTENDETLEFTKDGKCLTITASFSPIKIIVSLEEFEKAGINFYCSISNYIRENIPNEPSEILQKYLL